MSDQDVWAQGRRRLNRCGFWIHRLRFINGCCGIRFMSRRCRDRGGSMNRSVCRVMMGVAGLAVLGMTATPVDAQTDGKQVARGINSIQAIKEAGGWRVTGIMVQAESAPAPLLQEYLP